jgi:hypothetical protein
MSIIGQSWVISVRTESMRMGRWVRVESVDADNFVVGSGSQKLVVARKPHGVNGS